MTITSEFMIPVERVDAGPARWLTPVVRRTVDIVASLTLLTVLIPVFVLIVVVVRATTTGPAVFRQERVGRNLRPFVIYKFRTMFTGADTDVHRREIRRQMNGGGPLDGGVAFKARHDPRVTSVGRFLRRFSLDELPQLVNVLRGNMSLVGPRPSLPMELEMYPEWAGPRFTVKPGLTGLWQVEGRNEITVPEMLKLDVRYVEKRSLKTDAWILLRTIPVLVIGRGAA